LITFAERNVGDVFISWENEAFLASKEFGQDKFDIVVPSLSILAEPPVAVVDKVVDKKGTRAAAEEYLKFIYTSEAQEIAAKNFYRPRDPAVAKKYEGTFTKVELFNIDDVFGGWFKAQTTHFKDGGVFDSIYTN
jgi:sulfate transport system substrate-binding protein